jgi:ABC-type transport system involved in multi-copper enzyme maturation permease subunit
MPLLRRRKISVLIGVFICLGILVVTYWLCSLERVLDDEESHMLYAVIFMSLGILFNVIYPATCITSEKESRSWPLLLATTIDDGQIIFGKFIGILLRCLPVWFLLLGHVFFFSLIGYIHPLAVFQIGMLVTWIVTFLSGTGIYFSSRFKHTTTAVIMNFALAATVWAVLPIFLALIGVITHSGDDFVEAYMDTNPFIHAVVIMDATVSRGHNWGRIGRYDWVGFRNMDTMESMVWMFVCMLGYTFIGFLFACCAKRRLRRDIF